MSLRDILESDLENVFLSTDDFAEELVYVPATGKPRTVLGICDSGSVYAEDGSVLKDQESLTVLFSRDDENAVTGGVSDPKPGDRLRRPMTVAGKSETLEYTWNG